MIDKTLPLLTLAEVASHRSTKSCYVTLGNCVHDVTDFLDAHPGGADVVLEYAAQDVAEILKNVDSHVHSEAAYQVLDDSLVGYLALPSGADDDHNTLMGKAQTVVNEKGETVHPRTGMSRVEDLSTETDFDADYKTHQFLDLNKPLLMQIWRGGFSKDFYLEQVHRPRHFKGGRSAPVFGNFLEPLSLTPWWVIPLIWLPCVGYGTYVAGAGFQTPWEEATYWLLGLMFWTLAEYGLHRFFFHIDSYLPDNRVGITLHFVLHGIHHYLPMDKYRLVMPPTLFVLLATPLWQLAHIVFWWDWHVATAFFCGGMFGYICYDLTHYFLHHQNLPLWYKSLKKYHLQHHFLDYENGFGVTSRFWDVIFGTELVEPSKSR